MSYRTRQFLNSRMKRLVRYYVDATNGSDSNRGLSPTSAWQTIGKVNGESFAADDYNLFKRGETFADVDLARDPSVFYDAYGTGAFPVVVGSWIVGLSSVGTGKVN